MYIREGAPGIKVNGKSLEEYFPIEVLRDVVRQPLSVTANDEKLNILINVRGGGINGQAGAIRHGIARALVELDETNRPTLKANGFLTRDARMVERKKYVNPEHGRSSSSPNVKISELKREGTDGSVLRVRLEDGSLFLLDADHPAALHLSAGLDLDESILADLESASETYRCRRKALDLLARSEQCRRGLAVKLSKKGFSREAVSSALDRLVSAGFLDDRRFAEAWVRSRLRSRPEGPSRLRGALMSRGIGGSAAREAVETVLEELGDDEAEEAMERAWDKLSRRSGITDEKLLAALVRRGFLVSRVRALIRSKSSKYSGD